MKQEAQGQQALRGIRLKAADVTAGRLALPCQSPGSGKAHEAARIELPILQRTSSAWKADLDPKGSMETPREPSRELPHDPG